MELLKELKNKYNAWLVINVSELQDNGVYVNEYLLFIGNESYECYNNHILRKCTNLNYHRWRLELIADKLDDERKEKLLKILNQ